MNTKAMSYKIKQFLIFAGPATFLFTAVVILPFLYGMYLTFTSWDGVSKTKQFVGLENYVAAFSDKAYWHALGRTFVYSAAAVILVNVLAFILAYLLSGGVKGQNFFRAGFFVPNLIGGIVLGYIWKFVFNRALVAMGNKLYMESMSISLLSTTGGAMFCLIIVSVWQYAGYMMLIYIAGFLNVSDEVVEAARIDGCTKLQTLTHILIPLMTTSFVQCGFLTVTRCFMVYDINLSLTKGEPFHSSVLAAMHVYNQAFTYKNYGVGQAEAMILFLICAVIGLLQVYAGKKAEVSA